MPLSRRTWTFILAERETIETLVVIALLWALGAFIAHADQIPDRVALPLGFYIDREVSIGNLLVGAGILFQIGRWGRRMVTRFAHIPVRLTELELQIDEMQHALHLIDARCPLRTHGNAQEEPECTV